jgi:Capsule polysaccharide biosynthesis protein
LLKPNLFTSLKKRINVAWALRRNQLREKRMARAIAIQSAAAYPDNDERPVLVFNATTRLMGLSLNAAYSLLTAWSLRLSGVPVVHFVCQKGMTRCVLGTDRDNHLAQPPCAACMAESKALYHGARIHPVKYQPNADLIRAISALSVDELSQFSYHDLPLGSMALTSLRWSLRRHNLVEDEPTRFLFRQFILSAWSIANEFTRALDLYSPRAVIVFNGTFFPEAIARWLAQARGIPAFSHETAFLPFSVFFTDGEATAYPIEIPPDFELDAQKNARLDAYLEQRFHGRFQMAGIQFWPEMKGLDEAFLNKAAQFRQMAPVFTNVIFDTSQRHGNVIFKDMFAWLDEVLACARQAPDTLFVIRAHPDEGRPGKASRETVREWVKQSGFDQLPNTVFIDSHQFISSYELVQRAKFVLAYNSTICLEAAIMGASVLCGGKVRYHLPDRPTVYLPTTPEAYVKILNEFIQADLVEAPSEFSRNARRFMYFQLFRASLPFDRYLQTESYPQGFVRLTDFNWQDLLPDHSSPLRTLLDGLLNGKTFYLQD